MTPEEQERWARERDAVRESDRRLRDIGAEPWRGSDRWSFGGGAGRWTATREFAGSEIELACRTLNGLIAACRDLDRRTA